MEDRELYIGLMSGTSMDGVDAVLAEFSEHRVSCLGHAHRSYPAQLLNHLQRLCIPGDNEIEFWGAIDNGVAQVCVDVIQDLLESTKIDASQIKAIGAHGQTIRHRPYGIEDIPNSAFTLQIGDPNTIAVKSNIPVVADFRRKDIALGGQGAPLAPAFHNAYFTTPGMSQVVLNLGGIANITCLPTHIGKPIFGYDTGPANPLIDNWFQQHHNGHFDAGGEWAATGTVQQALLDTWLSDPYFSQPAPKSTGKEYFTLDWLARSTTLDDYARADIQATLVALTVESVAEQIEKMGDVERVLVCGGGVYNNHLMRCLQQRLSGTEVASTATVGVDPMHVEALAFAWLARQYDLRQPGNLPSVTGASRSAVLGALYYPD